MVSRNCKADLRVHSAVQGDCQGDKVMERIIIYGIGSDFYTYFEEPSLYRSLTEEMGATVAALCDGNVNRYDEKVLMGDMEYVIQDVCDVPRDSYDRIVVTTNKHFQEIREVLSEKGIDSKKWFQ